MNFPACDSCNTHITDDNAAPTCTGHDVCLDCLTWWSCRNCRAVWVELEADARAEYDRKEAS